MINRCLHLSFYYMFHIYQYTRISYTDIVMNTCTTCTCVWYTIGRYIISTSLWAEAIVLMFSTMQLVQLVFKIL